MEIRWDTTRMAWLAADVARKGSFLMSLRDDVVATCARVNRPAVDVRSMVIASLWADSTAAELLERRRLLEDAESELLWDLIPAPPDHRHLAQLRSREQETIEAELDASLGELAVATAGGLDRTAARAELRIMELTYELVVAKQNQLLLDRHAPDTPSALSGLIDYLGYEIAKSQPEPHLDWGRVSEATSAIRRLLRESWFADVGRADLLTIHEILAGLDGPELDAVIGGLSDDELYRWFHELDGIRGGNLSEAEEAALFDTLAGAASAATLFRLAGAERGSRFIEIATAVQQTAPAEVAMEFIEACAANASESDKALVAALAGLAGLDQRRRNAVAASMNLQGLLDPLADATSSFIDRQTIERDDPVIIEFFEGVGSAIGTAIGTLANLTVVGLVDRHRFRETWSQLGGLVAMAFTDPIEFAEIVIDLDTLRRNPARWLGSAAAGFATAGFGRLARIGRFGKLTGSAANMFKRLGDTVIISSRRLRLRARHASTALDHVGPTLDAAAISESIDELAQVEGYLQQLDEGCAPPSSP